LKNDEEIFQLLVLGGLIGGVLRALISKTKKSDALLGAIAGAVLLATYKANLRALEMNIPMCTEDNGSLYKIQPDGKKEFIRKIDKPKVIQREFKLK
jgi:hypothetical protein